MPRHHYLNPIHSGPGQRGGVAGDYNYELEIGHNSLVSEEMLALCVLYDEVMSFLQTAATSPDANNPVATAIVASHAQLVEGICREQREKVAALKLKEEKPKIRTTVFTPIKKGAEDGQITTVAEEG
jgi:hypothetical protein